MKKKVMTIISVLTFGLMVLSIEIAGATPIGTSFTYQGRLIDANSPAEGEYDFIFRIYNAESDGTQAGQDVNIPDVDIIDGYFTVELDFGNIFLKEARWLEIAVREGSSTGDFTTLSPRQKITPTPYAIHAVTAGNLQQDISESVVYDSDWLPMPMRTDLQIDLGTTDYDFVFPWLRSWNQIAGEVFSPLLGATSADYAPGYVSLSGSVLKSLGFNYLGSFNNLGERSNVLVHSGNVRYLGIKRAADYDTGWFPCTLNQTYFFNHDIGVFPHFALVEVSEHGDGSGWRVPTMSASNYGDSGWRQTAIIKLDSSSVIIRTQGSLARFRTSAEGTIISPTSAFCRVRLFDWKPDYDSGWVAISTTTGNRDKWLKHDLGNVPGMVMLYVAENSDETGWVVPAMSTYTRSYSYGTIIYDVTNRWAVVKGGSVSIAQFIDYVGSGKVPISGYIRFMAWK
jgi:hypothetical protein